MTDSFATTLELLHRATQSTVQTVDGLADSQWAEPSVLPGWSRAHVVAHLTNHALGTSRAILGLRNHQPTPIYDSNEARDLGIDRPRQLARRRSSVSVSWLLSPTCTTHFGTSRPTCATKPCNARRAPVRSSRRGTAR